MASEPTPDPYAERTAKLIGVLAHPDRLRIALLLAHKPYVRVRQLQKQLALEQSVVSMHLGRMKNRGLLVSVRRGKEVYYALAQPEHKTIIAMILEKLVNSNSV